MVQMVGKMKNQSGTAFHFDHPDYFFFIQKSASFFRLNGNDFAILGVEVIFGGIVRMVWGLNGETL